MKQRDIVILIVIILLLAGGGFGFWYWKKKQAEKKKAADSKDKENNNNGIGAGTELQSSDAVKQLQIKLNSQLPAGYELLEVDGKFGPKTSAAYNLIYGKKAPLPANEKEAHTIIDASFKITDDDLLDTAKKAVLLSNPVGLAAYGVYKLFSK